MTVEEAHRWLQGLIDAGSSMTMANGGSIGYNDQASYRAAVAQYGAAKCQEALAVLHYHENDRYGFLDDKPLKF